MIGSVIYRAVGLCAAAALLATAAPGCTRVDAGEQPVSKRIEIDGSSTVGPVSEAVATEFRAVDPDVEIAINISGTGGGFKRFVVGETDISNASRPIKASELASAQSSGVEFIELPIAYDGITLAVNQGNDWATDLTLDEIRRIFRKGSEIDTWADVRDGWPDRPIKLYAPGVASGTFDFFNEVVFADGGEARLGDIQVSEDDHVLARGVAGDLDALGFFGYAYYQSNRDKLRSLGVVSESAPAAGPVRPTIETIADGSYRPFSRPLYIYVNRKSAERPAVDAFVRFYLDNAARLAEEVGYVGLTPREYRLSERLFGERVTGTEWLDASGDHVHASIAEVYGL